MKVISKRLYTAQRFFHENDYETALIFIAIAIDGTAKRKYPELNGFGNVGERVKRFIIENHDFIIQLASGGHIVGFDGVKGKLKFGKGKQEQTLDKLIYAVRNALIHADEKNKIAIINAPILGKNVINYDMVHALLFAVIMDSANSDQKFDKELKWTIDGQEIKLNTLWGNPKKVKNILNIK